MVTVKTGIASNVSAQFASQAAVVFLAFFTAPYIVHHLGVDLYGVLVLVGLTTSYFGLVELGLGQASIKFLAESYHRNDRAEVARVFWTSVLCYLFMGCIGAATIVGFTPLLIRILNFPPTLTQVTTRVFLVSAIGLLITMQAGVASSVPRALERFDISSKLGAALAITQSLVSVSLLYLGFSLLGLVVGSVVIQFLGLTAYWLVIRSIDPGLGRPVFDLPTLKRLIRFGGFVTVSQVVGPLLVHLEKFIMGGILSLSLVAYYTVPYNLVWTLTMLPSAIAVVLFPTFARLNAAGQSGRVAEIFLRSTKFIFASLLPVAFMLAFYSSEFLRAWMGADFAAQSSIVLKILAFAVVINAVAWPAFQLLQAFGKPEVAARLHLLEVGVHVPLCFFLIVKFGLIGGAIAWGIRVLLDSILLNRRALAVIEIEPSLFCRKGFIRPFVACSLAVPIALVGKAWLQSTGRISTLISLAAIGGCYWLVAFWSGLDKVDKAYLAPHLRILGQLVNPPRETAIDNKI